MDNRDFAEDLQNQFNDVVSRFQSKEFFQSDWDIVSLSVLFIFIGEQMTFIPTLTQKCPAELQHCFLDKNHSLSVMWRSGFHISELQLSALAENM